MANPDFFQIARNRWYGLTESGVAAEALETQRINIRDESGATSMIEVRPYTRSIGRRPLNNLFFNGAVCEEVSPEFLDLYPKPLVTLNAWWDLGDHNFLLKMEPQIKKRGIILQKQQGQVWQDLKDGRKFWDVNMEACGIAKVGFLFGNISDEELAWFQKTGQLN